MYSPLLGYGETNKTPNLTRLVLVTLKKVNLRQGNCEGSYTQKKRKKEEKEERGRKEGRKKRKKEGKIKKPLVKKERP